MKVFDEYGFRLGNAIFRYMASSLFCILYNAERTYNPNEATTIFSEEDFIRWSDHIITTKTIPIIGDKGYKFPGFYQRDIYYLFKGQLIEWFKTHSNDTIISDVDNNNTIYSINELFTPSEKKYQTVLHIRLEDFVHPTTKLIMHPLSICNILDNIHEECFCIVVNKLTTQIEIDYIDYFKKRYNIIIESNDIITDFKIMNNAKKLICGLSTISWCAGFLSTTAEQIFFPKIPFLVGITNHLRPYMKILYIMIIY